MVQAEDGISRGRYECQAHSVMLPPSVPPCMHTQQFILLLQYTQTMTQACPLTPMEIRMSVNIKFTIEKEEEGRLAFLDVLVKCSGDQLSMQCTRKRPTQISTSHTIPTTIPEC